MGSPPDYIPLFSLRSHRLRIGLLLMVGLWSSVSMRLNLSMAVTCMVNSTAYMHPGEVERGNDSGLVELTSPRCSRAFDDSFAASAGYNGRLLWSPAMQSLLLSGTFYGGAATIAVSGYLADRFGPKTILILASMDYVLMSLLAPFLANSSFGLYFASRLVMGLGEGFVIPAMASLAARWFPATERSSIAAMYTSGNQLAAGLSPLISASLCAAPLLGGWPAIFYLFGTIGAVWIVVWWIFASNYPVDNRWTSAEEKKYLEGFTHSRAQKSTTTPWRAMFSSTAVHANLMCQFSFNLSATIMQGFLPTYFKQVLMLPISSNGVFTMIPFIFQFVAKNLFGWLSDWLKKKGHLRPTTAVKFFQIFSSYGSALALFGMATIPSCENAWTAAPLLAVYGTFFSAGICGFFTSNITIAPAYSGTMTSISMVFGMAANLFGPAMISLANSMNVSNVWLIIFGVCAVLNVLSGTFYLFFGSADVQSWAVTLPEKIDKMKAKSRRRSRHISEVSAHEH